MAAAAPVAGGGATAPVPPPRPAEPAMSAAPEGGERRRGGRGLAVAVGIGGVLAVTSAVIFESKAQGNYEASTREPDDEEQRDLYRSANRDHKLAQGAAIGGAALLVTGAVLWWRGGAPSRVAVTPASGGGASLVLGGRF